METPMKFWFYHKSNESLVYFASRDGDNYVVTGGSLKGGMHYCCADAVEMMYSNGEVERSLSGGDWIVVEEVFAKEDSSAKKPSAKKLISINVNSVRAAAEFDATNNKYTIKNNLSHGEIEQEILKYVREMYSGLMSGEFDWDYRVIGTRSYVVRFRAEDENYGVISVEVDPSIGMPSFYASVEDFLNQN